MEQTGMTRARLRRGVRKRREAREAKERKARRVPAFSLLPRLQSGAMDRNLAHTWGEPVQVSLSRGDHAVLRVCETCQGFVRRCKWYRRFHLVCQGQGGEYSMPWWVSASWLKEHVCTRRDLGNVPIPFVWMPDGNYPPEFDLATYTEIEGEPGRYELEWFS